MRIETSGKRKLAVGLTWRRIVTKDAIGEIIKKAGELRSTSYWTDPAKGIVGFAEKGWRPPKEPVIPAMVPFMRLLALDSISNALLVYKTSDDELIVLGVIQGKPANDFDFHLGVGWLAESTAIFRKFKSVAGGDDQFRTFSNVPVFREDGPADFNWEDLGQELLLTDKDALVLVNAMRQKIIGLGVVATVLILAAVAVWFGLRLYRDHQNLTEASQIPSPQVRYETAVNALAEVTPINIRGAANAIHSILERVPLTVGEWDLTKIDECKMPDDITGDAVCKIVYRRTEGSAATNATFDAVRPKDWVVSFQDTGTMIRATLRVGVKSPALTTILAKLPKNREVLLKTGSDFQKWSVLISEQRLSAPIMWGTPPAEPNSTWPAITTDNVTEPVLRGTWTWKGPARSLDLVTMLPAYFSVTNFSLDVKKDGAGTETAIKGSEFQIEKIEGVYYVR